jgi:hypothetical protein
MVCNNLDLIRVVLWTCLCVSSNAYDDTLFKIPSDLPGVNPATNDRMILYYCLTTKVDQLLGDSTVFFWAGFHSADFFPKHKTWDFPRFDCTTNPMLFLNKCESYFRQHRTMAEERVWQASFIWTMSRNCGTTSSRRTRVRRRGDDSRSS